MLYFWLCILTSILSFAQADTEVYSIDLCGGSSSLESARTWFELEQGLKEVNNDTNSILTKLEPVSDTTILSVKVEAYNPTADGSDPCANFPTSRCPHEARVILRTDALCAPHGLDLQPKFMTRVSWPASFPVDAKLIVHKGFNTSDTGKSGVDLGFRARSRGQPNPYVATTGVTDVPFIVIIERLLFGAIPGSILPLIGFILAGAVIVVWFANRIVFPGILELARQAEEESRSNSKQE